MSVCLITSEPRNSPRGERIAALAERLDAARVACTQAVDWPGSVPVDELAEAFDAAVAFGWRACLHLFRADARAYAYAVPALEDAQLWHGDERRLLASATYDLPLQLVAESAAVAEALRDRSPEARVAIVRRGFGKPAVAAGQRAADAPLRVTVAAKEDGVLERVAAVVEVVPLAATDGADVVLELRAPEHALESAPEAMHAGCVPVVTPVRGYEELVEDGRSGLVVEFDDAPGAAGAIDTLARDAELLARLREGALARAAELPSLDDEAAAWSELLAELPGRAPDRPWPRRLLLNVRAAAEPVASERRALEEALRAQARDRDDLRAALEAAGAEADALRRTLAEQRQAYRVGRALRPLWRPFVPLVRLLARALRRSAAPRG